MGLEFEIALALGPFEIFTFFGNSGHFCASRHGAVLGSPKSAIAVWGLSRKIKGHRILIPGARATLPPISGGNLGLHLPVPVPVSENRKSGVTRPWYGTTINIVYNSGTVITLYCTEMLARISYVWCAYN